jgi:hypothetical protein
MYVDLRLTKEEIGVRLGLSKGTVRGELARNGIRRETALEYYSSRHPREEVIRIYVAEGLLQADAASKLGMPTRAFQLLLQHYGINQRHKPGPKTCEIDDGHLRRQYAEDRHSIANIAAIFGCDETTIRTRLKKLGIYVARRTLSKLSDETLAELYTKRGLTCKQIGERYGVTPPAVYRRLAAIGIRRITRKGELDSQTLRHLYVEQHLTQRAIAAKLGVTRHRVCADLNYHGIDRDPESR